MTHSVPRGEPCGQREMAVTAPDLSPFEFGKPARSNHFELARAPLDLVEIRNQLIVG
jgi:hypothetical protein